MASIAWMASSRGKRLGKRSQLLHPICLAVIVTTRCVFFLFHAVEVVVAAVPHDVLLSSELVFNT